MHRPVLGGKYCQAHAAECTKSPEECLIEGHRQMPMGNTLALQYKIDGQWCDRSTVDIRDVRAYELSLLRRKSDKVVPETDTCNKDLRKGTSEMSAGRKSSGILAAVTPCVQILAIRPMYASESSTQVLL